jgi:periplasmic divalent cation tolerance protein
MGSSEELVVYISFPERDHALRVGRTLIEDHLAACVHLLPDITAIYRWRGVVEEDAQTVLMCKTTSAAWSALLKSVTDMHGLPAYLAWLQEEVRIA